jgi:hypothetical protein
VVSGTEPGSYGEGIVGPGDELLRIGIHNVPRGPPPKKPRRAIPGQRRRWRAPTASEVSCTGPVCLLARWRVGGRSHVSEGIAAS